MMEHHHVGEIDLPICRGVEIPSEVGEGDWIMVDGQCAWDGAWTFTTQHVDRTTNRG